MSKGAINELLLRDSDGSRVGLLGDGTFESCVSSEGPAGTAATLILDGVHEAVNVMIDSGGGVSQTTTSIALAESRGVSTSGNEETEEGHLLIIFHVGKEVLSELEVLLLDLLCVDRIDLCDFLGELGFAGLEVLGVLLLLVLLADILNVSFVNRLGLGGLISLGLDLVVFGKDDSDEESSEECSSHFVVRVLFVLIIISLNYVAFKR